MKYFICKNEEETIVIIKEITLAEYNKWKKCTEKLQYYALANNYRDIAIKNGLELVNYLKSIKKLSTPEEMQKINATSIGIEANRLILNYLVSFRTFVDNLQSYSLHLKKGKKFKENVLNKTYDNEPIYAFLSKLRNFATHFSMIFDSIEMETGKIHLQCSKKHLLEYDSWKVQNINFINSCNEDYLPILDYIEHNNILIMNIYLGFLNYFGYDIQDMHNQTMELMSEYRILNPFFIECENENNLVGAHIIGIGLDDLKKATDEFAQLPNVNITYISPEQILNDKNV